jgi:hypothetical protein
MYIVKSTGNSKLWIEALNIVKRTIRPNSHIYATQPLSKSQVAFCINYQADCKYLSAHAKNLGENLLQTPFRLLQS